MIKGNATDPLARGLEHLRKDPRFVSLFQARPMALALWILDVDLAGTSSARLLYAWAISSPPAPPGWTFSSGKNFSTGVPGSRYRFRRLVLTASPDTIVSVVTALLDGNDLADACAAAGVAAPERMEALRLSRDRQGIESSFVFGPVRFLGNHSSSVRDSLRPMSSPSRAQPTFCASLIRLEKNSLFIAEDEAPLPGADEIARQTLLYLKQETGLDFTAADAVRLGNIEWLALPTTDPFENEYVRTENRRTKEGDHIRVTHVDVTVRPGPLPDGRRILVRCRLFVGNDVATDECREGTVGGPTIAFPVSDKISRTLVTVWTTDEGGVARLWFENEAFLIREIVLHMGIMGLSGQLNSDWTQALAKKRKPLAERVDKVRALQQVSYEISSGGGRRASWELAERQINRLARRLFPQKSSARFFPRGWAEEGRVGFIEWFIELTSDAAASDILVVDPYFDIDGIIEFLARARAAQIRYAVLTNSQVASKDDPATVSGLPTTERKSARAERIRNACESTRDILSLLQFEIRDLRSKGASTDQLFHDRYILVFGAEHGEREIQKGFHLSNSIQGATRNSPLLVTPIPADVLDEVAAYVDSLVQADPAVVGEAETVTIASTETLRRIGTTDDQASIDFGEFFADLLDEPTLRALASEGLNSQLSTRAAIDDSGNFRFVSALAPKLRAFVGRLLERDDAGFARGWSLLGEWLAHMGDGKEEALSILRQVGASLPSRLEHLLEASPGSDPPCGFRGVPLSEAMAGHGHLFRRSFESVLEDAKYMLEFRDRFYTFRGYGIRYAIQALAGIAPERLVAIAEHAWDDVPPTQRGSDSAPSVRTALNLLGMILDQLLDTLPDDRVLAAMIASRMALLRAVAVQHVLPRPFRPEVDSSLEWLRRLDRAEELEVLAEWVSELRVEANRNDFKEPPTLREQRLRVFEELERVWPATIDDLTLRRLARRLGGPGEGGWASSTTEEFFARLVATEKLTWERVAGLWFAVLSERITSMLSEKCETRYSFYGPNDIPLIEAAVLALSRCTRESRELWREKLTALNVIAARTLSAPFVRSRHYSRWADTAEGLHWLQAVIGCVLLRAGDALDEEERLSWNAPRVQIAETLSHNMTRREPSIADFKAQVERALTTAGKPSHGLSGNQDV